MYDEYGAPSEALVMDWNEHNDHADGFREPDFDDDPPPPAAPVTLADLHALARRVREQIEAERIEFEAEDRARNIADAEQLAADVWRERFHDDGDPPPPLVWQGYADHTENGVWDLGAVAHLGAGVFLSHYNGHFALIAPCVCAPNRYRHDPVTWLPDLADALDQITGEHPECAHTCTASLADDRRTRR